MHLVQIDAVDIKAFQTGLALGDNAVAAKAFTNVSVADVGPSTLRSDDWPIGFGNHFECLAEQLFTPAETVDRRRVNPVDTNVNGSDDRVDRFGFILVTPPELPVTAANGPGSESNYTDLPTRCFLVL